MAKRKTPAQTSAAKVAVVKQRPTKTQAAKAVLTMRADGFALEHQLCGNPMQLEATCEHGLLKVWQIVAL